MPGEYEVNITNAFQNDLDEIHEYLSSNFSEEVTQRVMARLIADIERLETSPRLGIPLRNFHPELNTNAMRIVSGKHIIIYEIDEHRFVIDLLPLIRGERNYIQELFRK